jgi:hypothetical protein
MLASFLAIVFGQLISLDRVAGARLRQGLLILIGFGVLIVGGGLIGGAETARALGLRVAFFGVVLAILRSDYVIARLLVGPRVANVAAVFLATAVVVQEAAASYPSRALWTASSVAQLAGVLTIFAGACRAGWIALRRASGRDTTSG